MEVTYHSKIIWTIESFLSKRECEDLILLIEEQGYEEAKVSKWSDWSAVLYSSFLFSINHIAFGINSEINSGYDVVIATLILWELFGASFI